MKKLIPLKTQSSSHAFQTNLLNREGNVYLMDNHRMAAWCWANSINEEAKYTIIHIDKHFDTLGNQIDEWISKIPFGLKELSYNEYDNLEYQIGKFENFKVFRWDNYIPIFHHFYSKYILQYMFFTQGKGTIPEYLKNYITHYTLYNLLNDFPSYFEEYKDKLIINLDIDYFFGEGTKYIQLLSDEAINQIVTSLMALMNDKGNILTISLSPECCGGWSKSLAFVKKYFNKFDIRI